MILKTEEKNRSGIEIQCAVCGFIGAYINFTTVLFMSNFAFVQYVGQ